MDELENKTKYVIENVEEEDWTEMEECILACYFNQG